MGAAALYDGKNKSDFKYSKLQRTCDMRVAAPFFHSQEELNKPAGTVSNSLN